MAGRRGEAGEAVGGKLVCFSLAMGRQRREKSGSTPGVPS